MTIDTAITEHFEIPQDIAKLAARARTDLYSGPTYLDENDEEVSMFDESYVKPFDFTGACAAVSDWCGDNIVDMYYDADCGEMMECEPEWQEDEDGNQIEPGPYFEVQRSYIKVSLFGRELAKYL